MSSRGQQMSCLTSLGDDGMALRQRTPPCHSRERVAFLDAPSAFSFGEIRVSLELARFDLSQFVRQPLSGSAAELPFEFIVVPG
jgi:hypothetical protein